MKILVTLLLILVPLHSKAEEGWLKKRLKNKWVKRQAEKSAPLASREVKEKIKKPGTYTYVFNFQNIDRYYKVHLPLSYNPEKPIPVIFAFHGGGGNMEIQSTNRFYKLISFSERQGVVLVFPNGHSPFKSGKLATWNAGNCCGQARDQKIDDVGFIRELYQNLRQQIKTESKKVYAIGMSNGAMMSYRLACEASDLFKAIGAVAGTDNTIDCLPIKPVSILHIHATNDEHVNYQGGRGKKAASQDVVPEFTSVEGTLNKWKEILQCKGDFKVSRPKKELEIHELKGCQSGSQIKHIKLSDGGHSWPGGVKPKGKDETSKLISANDEIWKFFEGLP